MNDILIKSPTGEGRTLSPLFRPLKDALANVENGSTLVLTKTPPVAALIGLIALERRDIHLICMPTAGLSADLLAAGGVISALESGAMVVGNRGTTPSAVRRITEGSLKFVDSSCPMLLLQLLAGSAGLTFTAVPGLAGSDLLKLRPDIRSVQDPFDENFDVYVAPSLQPDVAIVHARCADRHGNVVLTTQTDERIIVRASQKVIATVEEIVDDLSAIAPDEQVIPEMYFDAISHIPNGAWPAAYPGVYPDDDLAFSAYMAASRDPNAISAFLETMLSKLEGGWK